MESGRNGENSVEFQENSGELSGIQWGFVWIQCEFLGDFGARLGFRENLWFGMVSGDLGPPKAFAQIATKSLKKKGT